MNSTDTEKDGTSITMEDNAIADLIERVNSLTLGSFKTLYALNLAFSLPIKTDFQGRSDITFEDPSSMIEADKTACFELVKETNAGHYIQFTVGSNAREKKVERCNNKV